MADVFDALSSARPYKEAFPLDKCLRILREGEGKHFDPRVLKAFFARLEQIVSIREHYAELEPENLDQPPAAVPQTDQTTV